MSFSNEGCCCCGVITGFLLAAFAGAVLYYVVFVRKTPGTTQREMETVTRTWSKVKSGGDALLERARKETRPAPSAPAAPVYNVPAEK